MVRDDLEACTQAYRFAQLLLAREPGSEKDREQAIAAAKQLRGEVEERYQRVKQDGRYAPNAIATLDKLRAELDARLSRLER
jgi:hypothetical protein